MPLVLRLGKKILIIALLLVMPLQGFAASLSHLLCSSSSAAEQTLSGHHHDAGDDSIAPHDRDDGGNDSGKSHAGHLSCHQLSSALPSVAVTVCASNLSVFVPTIFVLPSLFFPEQPQRPPLA